MAESPAAPARGPYTPIIILVRPQLGENVGTTARAMLNFGLTDLRLVAPQCGWPNAKALQAASGATEVLNRLSVLDRVADAASDLHRLYATTARSRDLPKPVVTAAQAAREARAALQKGERVGILFGPERTGLPNDDLIYADALVSIPANPDFFSLNLAQAVLLVAYEWFESGVDVPDRREIDPAGRPATKGELDQLLERLIADLDEVDFFRTADRRASMSRALQLIFARAELREPDVHLLRGVIKELARGGRRPPRGGG
jgi:tRNA/rRNA methyltransferase